MICLVVFVKALARSLEALEEVIKLIKAIDNLYLINAASKEEAQTNTSTLTLNLTFIKE